jgi:hypothetical protein
VCPEQTASFLEDSLNCKSTTSTSIYSAVDGGKREGTCALPKGAGRFRPAPFSLGGNHGGRVLAEMNAIKPTPGARFGKFAKMGMHPSS